MTMTITPTQTPMTLLSLSASTLPIVFHDVIPISPDDGPDSNYPLVCVIDYPPDFSLAHDYLRALLQSNERSERALALTTWCLKLNPANYTTWTYRRDILKERGYDRQEELKWTATLGGRNPKHYQLWHHRRAILEKESLPLQLQLSLQHINESNIVQDELTYITQVLNEDGKNYHAWSHRQWILLTYNSTTLWQQELPFIDTLIIDDGRNNSAWNHRWFVTHNTELCNKNNNKLTRDQASSEASYAIVHCQLDPYNESPWRYLIGVLKEVQVPDLVEEFHSKAVTLKSVLLQAKRDPESCVSLNSALIDMMEMRNTVDTCQQAMELAQFMAQIYDTIRVKYWNLRKHTLQAKIQHLLQGKDESIS
jgi:protein farnesyltransferase/geranylgeranyltransferase type-1 subunit alpha